MEDRQVEETVVGNLVEEVEIKENSLEEQEKGFWQDDRGVGVIEIVLILVILIGLILVFKEQITAIINNAFATMSGNAGKILN